MPPKGVQSLMVYGQPAFFEDVKKAAALEPDGKGGIGMPVSGFVRLLVAEGIKRRFGSAKRPKLPQHLKDLRDAHGRDED